MKVPTNQVYEVIVDGRTYQFYHLSIRVLNKMMFKILKLVGPSIAESLDIELGKTKDQVIKSLLTILKSGIDPDILDQLTLELLSATICVGHGKINESNFDIIFTDITHFWKVIIEAGKYYFASFFEKGSPLEVLMVKGKSMMTEDTQEQITTP